VGVVVRELPRRASAADGAREGERRADRGLDYKDKDPEAKAWLEQHGNPYALSVVDADGRVGIDWGVYGVPETFVVDKAGVIRYKHIGPVTVEALQKTILPLVQKLKVS
jgi:cytochrome c biogenesis protein CcmG/thiol:disulfide interchange protein DsbE